MKSTDNDLVISLSRSQALILFDWIADTKPGEIPKAPDEATMNVLWFIEGRLESTLVEILDPEYTRLLAAAKDAVLRGEPLGPT